MRFSSRYLLPPTHPRTHTRMHVRTNTCGACARFRDFNTSLETAINKLKVAARLRPGITCVAVEYSVFRARSPSPDYADYTTSDRSFAVHLVLNNHRRKHLLVDLIIDAIRPPRYITLHQSRKLLSLFVNIIVISIQLRGDRRMRVKGARIASLQFLRGHQLTIRHTQVDDFGNLHLFHTEKKSFVIISNHDRAWVIITKPKYD